MIVLVRVFFPRNPQKTLKTKKKCVWGSFSLKLTGTVNNGSYHP
jgi:hypothetical protein